jgi:predicted DNA-binding WGR domain protein
MKYAIIDQRKNRQVKQFDSYAAAEATCNMLNLLTRDKVKGGYPRFVIGSISE